MLPVQTAPPRLVRNIAATHQQSLTELIFGFLRQAFTEIFIIGRVGGWITHAREQARTGKLIRSNSVYIGP